MEIDNFRMVESKALSPFMLIRQGRCVCNLNKFVNTPKSNDTQSQYWMTYSQDPRYLWIEGEQPRIKFWHDKSEKNIEIYRI